MTRWALLGFAVLLNIVAALWLASLTRLFAYLTIGFNSHNQGLWFTTREIITIIVVDMVAAFVVAFTASKVLLLVNRVLKLSPKLASGFASIVFVSIGVTLIVTFVQGFKQFA